MAISFSFLYAQSTVKWFMKHFWDNLLTNSYQNLNTTFKIHSLPGKHNRLCLYVFSWSFMIISFVEIIYLCSLTLSFSWSHYCNHVFHARLIIPAPSTPQNSNVKRNTANFWRTQIPQWLEKLQVFYLP